MSKKRLVPFLACLFLVHSQVALAIDAGTYFLNPSKKVSPTNTSVKAMFARQFNIIAFALGMYYLDTSGNVPKEDIKKIFEEEIVFCEENFNIVFDLDNIDFKKKGFTRYYPFTVNGQDFIIRLFDVREKSIQPACEVYYEGIMEDSGVCFQIIPGIKVLLADTKVEPIAIVDPTLCDRQL